MCNHILHDPMSPWPCDWSTFHLIHADVFQNTPRCIRVVVWTFFEGTKGRQMSFRWRTMTGYHSIWDWVVQTAATGGTACSLGWKEREREFLSSLEGFTMSHNQIDPTSCLLHRKAMRVLDDISWKCLLWWANSERRSASACVSHVYSSARAES